MTNRANPRLKKAAALAALTLALSLPASGILAASTFEAHYTTASVTAQEQIAGNLLNLDRSNYNLAELTIDPALSRIARLKSEDMRDNRYFAHVSPTYGDVRDMLSKLGYAYTAAGENIAHHATIEKAQAALISSPGHRRNILSRGYTKVGVVYCSADTYSAGLRDAFIAACQSKGLEVVAEESVATMTEVDYSNQFNKMVSAGAELVFTPFYYDVMGPYLVPQARSAGFTGILLGADGVDSTETTIPAGADLSVYNNVYFVNHYSTELATSDVSKNFVAAYEAKYGETPNNFDALAYDAVYVYKAAMEACGASDAASVQAALADTSVAYDSTCGTFSFDETGTPIKGGVLMGYTYTDGDAAVTKITVKDLSLN